MSSHLKLGPVLALILTLSACGGYQPAGQKPETLPTSAAPTALDSPTLSPTEKPEMNILGPAPAIASLKMMD